MFVKIDKISCCFVKSWRYCFIVENFYYIARKFMFFDACQLPTLFCLNLCFVEIIFQENLFLTKNSNLDKLILWFELLQMNQSFLLLTKHNIKLRHTKWKNQGEIQGLCSMEHLDFIFFSSAEFFKATY